MKEISFLLISKNIYPGWTVNELKNTFNRGENTPITELPQLLIHDEAVFSSCIDPTKWRVPVNFPFHFYN